MTCQVCGEGHLQAGTTSNSIDSDIGKLEVVRHFHWCDVCGTEMALAKDTKANVVEARNARRHAVRLSADQINEVISVVGMSQEAAGAILGGGSVAFSKYKHGAVLPAEAMDNLLWLIKEYPFLAKKLAIRHGMPDAVRLAPEQEILVYSPDHADEESSDTAVELPLHVELGSYGPMEDSFVRREFDTKSKVSGQIVLEIATHALDEDESREAYRVLKSSRKASVNSDSRKFWSNPIQHVEHSSIVMPLAA